MHKFQLSLQFLNQLNIYIKRIRESSNFPKSIFVGLRLFTVKKLAYTMSLKIQKQEDHSPPSTYIKINKKCWVDMESMMTKTRCDLGTKVNRYAFVRK